MFIAPTVRTDYINGRQTLPQTLGTRLRLRGLNSFDHTSVIPCRDFWSAFPRYHF